MIDSVRFSFPWHEGSAVLSHLTGVRESVDPETGEVVKCTGSLDNFHVSLDQRGLSLYGSLPKFYTGSNLFPMTPHETREAMGELSRRLSLNVDTARIVRLDFGFNLPLVPAEVTAAVVHPSRRYARVVHRGNLTYYNARRSVVLYDKGRELKEKGLTLPDGIPPHLLRVEVQLKKAVKPQMREPVYGRSLGDPEFHARMLRHWDRETTAFRFLRRVGELSLGSWTAVRDSLAVCGIESLGGLGAVLHQLEWQRESGLWGGPSGEKALGRTRSQLLLLHSNSEHSVRTEVEAEFRRAVKEVVERWRRVLSN